MKCEYSILLDVADKSLAEFTVETSLSLDVAGRLYVVESHAEEVAERPEEPFGVFIFDEAAHSAQEVEAIAAKILEHNPQAIFIHVGETCARNTALHLIGMSRDLFVKCFAQLLGFCYVSYAARHAIAELRGRLNDRPQEP